jgi:glycerophosphoryl diester phosphodiesterase
MRPRRARALGLALAAFAACSDSPATAGRCAVSEFRSTPPKVIAHAGGEGLGPPNSLIAMERSMAAGADILDIDAWMTRDGVIVATHDRNLAAVTGANVNVDEITWDELQRLDLRAGWTGEPIAEPVRMPSAEQVLTAFPDTTLSIELKQVRPSMAGALCDVLERTDSFDRVYLSANDDAAVYEARDECPVVLITTTYADVDEMRVARETGADWCAPAPIGQPPFRADRFDAESVRWSHDHGMAIYTWTVDDPDTLRMLADAGVDGVYTRRPDVARAVFDEFAATRTTESSPGGESNP